MRLYVIGNDNCVLGFSLVGVGGRVVHSGEELDQALDTCLNDPTIGLLLVTEDVAAWRRDRIDEMRVSGVTPLVVEIPGKSGDQHKESLRDIVQRSVGIRLGG